MIHPLAWGESAREQQPLCLDYSNTTLRSVLTNTYELSAICLLVVCSALFVRSLGSALRGRATAQRSRQPAPLLRKGLRPGGAPKSPRRIAAVVPRAIFSERRVWAPRLASRPRTLRVDCVAQIDGKIICRNLALRSVPCARGYMKSRGIPPMPYTTIEVPLSATTSSTAKGGVPALTALRRALARAASVRSPLCQQRGLRA